MELASLRGGCWRGGVAAGGEGFPPQRDLRGFGGSGGKVASVSPAQLGARKPAGLPPRPGPPPSGDPSSLVGSRGTGGREGGRKGEVDGGGEPSRIRGSGENVPSISPVHLGPGEPVGVLGLVLFPLRPPQAAWVLGA